MCPELDAEYRDPTTQEVALLRRLLGHAVAGQDELARQLASLEVKSLDGDGSLKLMPGDSVRANDNQRIPVEATYGDSDGVVVYVLLHVVDGRLNELEVFREDSGPVGIPPVWVEDIDVHRWPGL